MENQLTERLKADMSSGQLAVQKRAASRPNLSAGAWTISLQVLVYQHDVSPPTWTCSSKLLMAAFGFYFVSRWSRKDHGHSQGRRGQEMTRETIAVRGRTYGSLERLSRGILRRSSPRWCAGHGEAPGRTGEGAGTDQTRAAVFPIRAGINFQRREDSSANTRPERETRPGSMS
jgi:hypothetical protein